jgi:hypothetical protein
MEVFLLSLLFVAFVLLFDGLFGSGVLFMALQAAVPTSVA